jgi:hypothetical protein
MANPTISVSSPHVFGYSHPLGDSLPAGALYSPFGAGAQRIVETAVARCGQCGAAANTFTVATADGWGCNFCGNQNSGYVTPSPPQRVGRHGECANHLRAVA